MTCIDFLDIYGGGMILAGTLRSFFVDWGSSRLTECHTAEDKHMGKSIPIVLITSSLDQVWFLLSS